MRPDTVHIECPDCSERSEITVYKGPREGIDFTLDDAPLVVIAEVNYESRQKRIVCTHCGLDIAIVVRFMANARPFSGKFKEGWRRV